jgi:hypothetical protein
MHMELIDQGSESAFRRKVHFIMNSKGGVGKSHVCWLLKQFYDDQGIPCLGFDVDATTASFSSFKSLKVSRIELLRDNRIDPRLFDEVLESSLSEDAEIIVDTGASSYAEWAHYLIENDVHRTLLDAGKDVVVHAIIVGGGQTLLETLKDLDDLATQLPAEVLLVVWLNGHFGQIEQTGKRFEDMEVYSRHRSRIHAVIELPPRTAATFGADMAEMMKRRLTFQEAIASPQFNSMAKHRLKQIRGGVFRQLSLAI